MSAYRKRIIILSAMEAVVWLLAIAWLAFVAGFAMEVLQ
jgi:hypothetical protein